MTDPDTAGYPECEEPCSLRQEDRCCFCRNVETLRREADDLYRYGPPPAIEEIATHMGLSPAEVRRLLRDEQ